MEPVLKVLDINLCQKPPPMSKKAHYYVRSARSALVLSYG